MPIGQVFSDVVVQVFFLSAYLRSPESALSKKKIPVRDKFEPGQNPPSKGRKNMRSIYWTFLTCAAVSSAVTPPPALRLYDGGSMDAAAVWMKMNKKHAGSGYNLFDELLEKREVREREGIKDREKALESQVRLVAAQAEEMAVARQQLGSLKPEKDTNETVLQITKKKKGLSQRILRAQQLRDQQLRSIRQKVRKGMR